MTLVTYSSIRQHTDVTFSVASGGSLSAGSAWFSVQARNRVGRNLLSAPVQLTWSNGSKVVVTFGANARANGEEIFEFIISSCPTNSFTQMRQICAFRPRFDLTIGLTTYPGQGSYKTLPQILEITTDAQVAICPAVANAAALPSSGMLYGAMRYNSLESKYVRWDGAAWVDSTLSELETYQIATTLDGGCDQTLSAISESEVIYVPPPYSGNGTDSQPVGVWISNGLTTGGATLPQGSRFRLQFFAGGREVSSALSRRVILRMLGVVNRSTGVLTALPSGILQTTWDYLNSIEMPVDLPAGSALALELVFRWNAAEIMGILTTGSKVLFNLILEGLLGQPDSSWYITGDVILDVGDLLRIVPVVGGGRRLGGACLIKGYRSPFVGTAEVNNLDDDTADQQAAISAALAAKIAVRAPGDSLSDSEALRALIGTEAGIQTPSAWQSVTTTTLNPSIELTINYPSAVRSNYPDVIAGSSAAEFNAPEVIIFVRSGSTIYQSDPITPAAPTQVVQITALPATTIPSLPTSPSSFGLFGYGTIAVVPAATPGTLAAGTYDVAIAYSYPSPNTEITSISHSPIDGCVGDLQTLTEALQNTSEILTGEDPPLSGQGTINDVYLQVDSPNYAIKVYRKNAPTSWTQTGELSSPPGEPGANGYSLTSAAFDMPAPAATVVVALDNLFWMRIGMEVYVEDAGYLRIDNMTSTTATLYNLGYSENATEGATISSARFVTTAGARGPIGQGAFTVVTADFYQPDPEFGVTVTVASTAWMASGMTIFIESAGYMTVYAINSPTEAYLINAGVAGNASSGSYIPALSKVTAGGAAGGTGGGGGAGEVDTIGLTLQQASALPSLPVDEIRVFNWNNRLMLFGAGFQNSGGFSVRTTGNRDLWIPATDFYPSVVDGCGALTAINLDAAAPTLRGLLFSGDGSARNAEAVISLPRSWQVLTSSPEAIIDAALFWIETTSGSTAQWSVGMVQLDSALNVVAYPSLTDLVNLSGSVNTVRRSTQTQIAIDGSSPLNALYSLALRVQFQRASASADAYLLGVKLTYRNVNPNDSGNWT